MEAIRPTSRQAILDAAAKLLVEDPGASLVQIAKTAGVGRATLHRLFANRDALLRDLALEALAACDAACEGIEERASSASEALRAVIEAILPLGDRFHIVLMSEGVFADPDVAAVYERQMREMDELIDAVKQEGGIDLALPTRWIVSVLDALIYTAWTSMQAGDIARNDAPALVYRTFLRGAAPTNSDSSQ